MILETAPHEYVGKTYRPTVNEITPLGGSNARTRGDDDFVVRLLERAKHPGYDPELAYVLSVIAGWSYSDGQTLSNKLKYYGLPFNTVDEVRVVNPAMLVVASAFLVRSRCGRVGILSFRGTEPESAVNWLTDADVVQRAIAGGRVHQGFYANLEAIWDDLAVRLADAVAHGQANGEGNGPEERRSPMERLYVTGHSLGGAMAALAAARIFEEGRPVPRDLLAGVYTFGQPAVGDLAFASQCEESFGQIVFRHVFAYDVVPHLPPRSSGKFEHFGQERVTFSVHEPWAKPEKGRTKQARLIVTALAATFASFLARRIHFLAKIPFPYSFDDHSPTRYILATRSGRSG